MELGKNIKENSAESIYIDPSVVSLFVPLLRSHVGFCAPSGSRLEISLFIQRTRKPKIAEKDMPIIETHKNVRRFNIPIDYR